MLLTAAALPARAAPPVSVCLDPEPPPWSYWKRDAEGNPTQELTGFSVDLVRRLFHGLGREVHFRTDMPWPRCLHELRAQKSGFAMDSYGGGRHAEQMLYSAHYNTLSPQVFTLRDHPIEIESPADLKHYKGCGIVNGSYERYGLSPQDLDLSANGYPGVVMKLKGHYCDYFVDELEVLAGLRLSHQDFLDDPDIVHHALKGMARTSLHLATARDGADAALIPKLDALIEAMDKSGELAVLWRKYGGDIPYSR